MISVRSWEQEPFIGFDQNPFGRFSIIASARPGTGDKFLVAEPAAAHGLPLQHWAKIILDTSEQIRALQNGQTISVNAALSTDLVRVYQPDNRLLAIAKVNYTEGKCSLKPERVFHI